LKTSKNGNEALAGSARAKKKHRVPAVPSYKLELKKER